MYINIRMNMEQLPEDIIYHIMSQITDYNTYKNALPVWEDILNTQEMRNKINSHKRVRSIEIVEKYKDFPNMKLYLYRPIFVSNERDILKYKQEYPNAYITHVCIKGDDNVQDLELYSNVHTISMFNCQELDLTPIRNAYSVSIIHSDIENVNILENVIQIHLESCEMLENVQLKARSVTLVDIPLLEDISGLENVISLMLCKCPGITDLSSLCNLKYLLLSNCPGITDVSCLKNLSRLSISNCPGITDVSMLNGMDDVEVYSSCNRIGNLASLNGVRILRLYSYGVLDVSVFDKVEILILLDCAIIVNLHKLKHLQCIYLVECFEVEDELLNNMPNTEWIDFDEYDKMKFE